MLSSAAHQEYERSVPPVRVPVLVILVLWLFGFGPTLEGVTPGRRIIHDLARQVRTLSVASGSWKSISGPASGPGTIPSTASDTSSPEAGDSDLLPVPRPFDLWQRERLEASKHGFEYYLESSGEYYHTLQDPSGDRNRSYYHDFYAQVSIDLAKTGAARAGTVFASIFAGGERVFSKANQANEAASTPAPDTTTPGSGNSLQLYELWHERRFGRASWLAGLRDLTSDFFASRFNDVLANGGFWFGTDLSENLPLAIYDVTTLGLRCRYDFDRRFALLAGLFEGSPAGSEKNPYGIGWHIGSDEGFFRIAEIQLANPLEDRRRPGALKVGTWHHSGMFNDLRNLDENEDPLRRERAWGNYLVFEQQLTCTATDSERGLGVFFRAGGGGPIDRLSVESALAAGFTLTGTFRGRDRDVLSIGLSRTNFSTALREYNQSIEEPFLTREEVLEIAYRYQIRPGLTIRPDLQIYRNVGGDPTQPLARYFSLRCTAIF